MGRLLHLLVMKHGSLEEQGPSMAGEPGGGRQAILSAMGLPFSIDFVGQFHLMPSACGL